MDVLQADLLLRTLAGALDCVEAGTLEQSSIEVQAADPNIVLEGTRADSPDAAEPEGAPAQTKAEAPADLGLAVKALAPVAVLGTGFSGPASMSKEAFPVNGRRRPQPKHCSDGPDLAPIADEYSDCRPQTFSHSRSLPVIFQVSRSLRIYRCKCFGVLDDGR